MTPDRLIDLSGLNCPLPILRAKKALADFEAFCRQTGNALLESTTTAEGKFRMVLRRK